MDKDKSTITLTPKSSFLIGVIGGVLVICTVGFFILLSILIGGDVRAGGDVDSADKNVAGAQVPPSDQDPPSAPSEPQVGDLEPVGEDDHVRGNADAEVLIVTYSDIECPYCGRFHETMSQLMDEYGDEVRWVFRHFPLSFHPNAVPAANAVECAGEQGKSWEYMDELFENQASLGTDLYGNIAGDLGLNKSKFDDCVSSGKYSTKVSGDMASGGAAGVTGTPGSIIVGADGEMHLVPGAVPYAQLKAMVDAAL